MRMSNSLLVPVLSESPFPPPPVQMFLSSEHFQHHHHAAHSLCQTTPYYDHYNYLNEVLLTDFNAYSIYLFERHGDKEVFLHFSNDCDSQGEAKMNSGSQKSTRSSLCIEGRKVFEPLSTTYQGMH